jgi:hypothetical protein
MGHLVEKKFQYSEKIVFGGKPGDAACLPAGTFFAPHARPA